MNCRPTCRMDIGNLEFTYVCRCPCGWVEYTNRMVDGEFLCLTHIDYTPMGEY